MCCPLLLDFSCSCSNKPLIWNTHYCSLNFANHWLNSNKAVHSHCYKTGSTCFCSVCGSGVSLSDHPKPVVSTLDGFVINQQHRRQRLYKWHTGLKLPGPLSVWPPPSPPILPQEAAFPLPVAYVFRWKCMALLCVYVLCCSKPPPHVCSTHFFFVLVLIWGETKKHKTVFLLHFTDLFIW